MDEEDRKLKEARLKPCPFCGPEGEPRYTPRVVGDGVQCSVRCWNCGAGRQAYRGDGAKLVKWWNTRKG